MGPVLRGLARIINGKPGNLLDPAGVSTRAEAAVMFRAMDLNVLA